MTFESLIEHYGYAALFLGTFLEGETILIIAGFAAHRGYLALPLVLLVAYAGAVTGDQLWFFVGRIKGRSFVAARPIWARRSTRVQSILDRHELLVVIGFRFVYGIKTVTPLLLGAAGYNPMRFVALNLIGAACGRW